MGSADYRITEARKRRVTINGAVPLIGAAFVLSVQLHTRRRKTTPRRNGYSRAAGTAAIDAGDKTGIDFPALRLDAKSPCETRESIQRLRAAIEM